MYTLQTMHASTIHVVYLLNSSALHGEMMSWPKNGCCSASAGCFEVRSTHGDSSSAPDGMGTPPAYASRSSSSVARARLPPAESPPVHVYSGRMCVHAMRWCTPTNDDAVVALLLKPEVRVYSLLQRIGEWVLRGKAVLEGKHSQPAMGVLAARAKGGDHALKHGGRHMGIARAKAASVNVEQHGGVGEVMGPS